MVLTDVLVLKMVKTIISKPAQKRIKNQNRWKEKISPPVFILKIVSNLLEFLALPRHCKYLVQFDFGVCNHIKKDNPLGLSFFMPLHGRRGFE